MHMYNLKQDLQSDIFKIDPKYMNKAIIDKIKIQNRKWQQSALAMAQSNSPLASSDHQPPQVQFIDNNNHQQQQQYAHKSFDRPSNNNNVSVMQVRAESRGSTQLEIANGLYEIQELEKVISSGNIHTRTLSNVE